MLGTSFPFKNKLLGNPQVFFCIFFLCMHSPTFLPGFVTTGALGVLSSLEVDPIQTRISQLQVWEKTSKISSLKALSETTAKLQGAINSFHKVNHIIINKYPIAGYIIIASFW